MLKLTKMLSLAGTLMVLGSMNSAQGAVKGEPPVANPNNGNPVEEITGLQVLNSDSSLFEIFTVNFQFDSFVTTFGDNPSSEAFFVGNTTGAISALTAINNAMNDRWTVVSTIPTQVVGTTSFNSDPNVPIVHLGNYRIPATLDLNANEVATIIGQFTNDAWGGGTTQTEDKTALVMYAKFTKTGEIDVSAIPESSNLVSLLVFGTSLLFVAKNRIG